MGTEAFDVPQQLARRKHKHIITRGIAEGIDLILLVVVSSLLVAILGESVGLIVFPAMLAYFVLMESQVGHTLGKRILGLRVVGASGSNPTIGESLIRNVVRPFEAFGLLGVIVVASTDKGQRIGDLLASTFVVQANELETLLTTKSNIATNELPSSREIVPITPKAVEVAKKGIADAYEPNETGLCVSKASERPHGLAVQFDIIDVHDDSWRWTTGGVTVSVPRGLTERCAGLIIDADDGTLVFDVAT